MKLYPIPGGEWAGTEADWKAAMKAKGLNPKEFEATKTRDVPTGKKELMEFLTFFAVDVYRTGGAPAAPIVDLEALRRQHNPEAAAELPVEVAATVAVTAAHHGAAQATHDLDDAFAAAPIGQQLRLSGIAIDNALAALSPRK